MKSHSLPSRRKAITTGLASLAAASVQPGKVFTAPKAPGETKVIYFGGDYIHNGVGFIAFHCTAGNPELPKLMELLGVKPLRSGAPLQPVRFHDFNVFSTIPVDCAYKVSGLRDRRCCQE